MVSQRNLSFGTTSANLRTMVQKTFAQLVHSNLKCRIRAALYFFIRTDLSQHLFQSVYHRQTNGDAQKRRHIDLKSGMHIMQVDIIVCHDRHIIIARIIQ